MPPSLADSPRVGVAAPPGRRPGLARTARTPLFTIPQIPPWLIVVASCTASVIAGRLFADGRIKYAAALVLAAIYAPLVFFDLAWAFAIWVAVLFIQSLHALSIGPNTMGVLVGLGWLGAFVARAGRLRALRDHRKLLLATIAFVLWVTLSIAWAGAPGRAASAAGYWWLTALVLLVTITTVISGREVSVVALAFVGGAVVAAVIGLVGGGLNSESNAVGQTAIQGRLTGGGGDPNVQAAAFLASMFMTIGLLSIYRRHLARLLLLLSFIVVTVAFFATQSRGGLIALAISTVAALLIARRQRRRILAFVIVAGAIAAVAIAIKPGMLNRITDFGGGTSGRSDVWNVATDIFERHPVIGIGAANFQVTEPRFALKIHNATHVNFIAEQPHLVHNSYLQLLVEEGIIGLALFLLVVVACVRSMWRAKREFERARRFAYGDLALATMMATIAMLCALFFISEASDWRLWVLLGLGPALLALARSRTGEAAAGDRT
jgi:hypothetical protein